MNQSKFLVAIALIQQGEKRAMPISGKSLKTQIDESPLDTGKPLIGELLLRVFQRTEDRPLQRFAGDRSLMLFVIEMDLVQEKIPLLKSEWIRTGDTDKFLGDLKVVCGEIWAVKFVKYEGVQFLPL